MPDNTVYVGRGSKWENPFFVVPGCGLEGIKSNEIPWKARTAKEAVYFYRRLLSHLPLLRQKIESELRGKNLACWCKMGEHCHADYLLDLANKCPSKDVRYD